jgi:hypothetical protein
MLEPVIIDTWADGCAIGWYGTSIGDAAVLNCQHGERTRTRVANRGKDLVTTLKRLSFYYPAILGIFIRADYNSRASTLSFAYALFWTPSLIRG